MSSDERSKHGVATRLIHSGRSDPRLVASPVHHGSTVLFPDYATFRAREAAPLDRKEMYYGRMGTPSTRALEDQLCELDGAVGAVLTPSGVASIADILSAFLSPGDHLLMVDSCYGPTRNFCNGTLKKRGISTEYYDPLIGADIEDSITESTRMIFLESPGTATFEVQDVPAIVEVARAKGVLTAIDNTWATPLLFNPLLHGVDLAMQSGTKYLNGHADCLFGVTTTGDEELYRQLLHHTLAHGRHLAPDDAFLAQRGLRTLPLRLAAHEAAGLAVAHWLQGHDRVRRLLHPAFSDCPGHDVFERDFAGASGLFAVILEVGEEAGLARFIDNLELFGVGYSWGGFESLALPMDPTRVGSSFEIAEDEVLLRLHIGLEDTEDLMAELDRALGVI